VRVGKRPTGVPRSVRPLARETPEEFEARFADFVRATIAERVTIRERTTVGGSPPS
jgi:hypothetical protein